ncbi:MULTISPECIES: hydroxyisourate hydrolase [Sphingobacterium]|uniref:5-hydroxyisourate hydrolase n=1 Tax=Sphingobacterium populi TaxID=1812824 RepID=A0ABW5U9J6_9SPHI|nr:hydroxyisourate hydrolase [Sphingobacterium sp. CFCC 11742]
MEKIIALLLAFAAISQGLYAQETSCQLSSHVLDINAGRPAQDIKITLSKKDQADNWNIIDEKITNSKGRIDDFLPKDGKDTNGVYKLTFHTQPYFKALNQRSFYPFIEVVFELLDQEHYHVPITLSPFGYSTYRGN